jgi:CHAT domain-containing protein/tetratricopeptide (TPR) repeat protein
MSILRILGFAVLVTMPLYAESPKPVAIVYSLAGKVSMAAPKTASRPLRLFDRLPAGTALEVGPGSRLALAFMNGLRYELREGSSVMVGAKDLASRKGPVRPFPRVPPLPRLSPIAAEDHPGPRAGAVRIRSEIISGLHPDRGAVSLASAIRLRFDPVPVATQYRVQIVDPEGQSLFRVDIQDTEVSVPPGILAPGGTYRWTVETHDRPGAVARGEAALVVLDARRARAREELRLWTQGSGVLDDLQLLKGVDRALGLWEEPDDAAGAVRCPLSEPGLVIETVTPESAAFRAGLTPGDRLFSWCRASGEGSDCVARGDFRTPFDWLDVQMEDVQRGGVVVSGTRGPENLRWNLLPTIQGLTVAPLFHGSLAEAYETARSREQTGDPQSAGKELERAAGLADGSHCDDAALWLRARAAQLRAKAREWPEVDAEYEAVVANARALGTTRTEEHLLMSWADTLVQRGEATQARQMLERALRLEERDHPESLGVVMVLTRLGNVALNVEGDPEEADLVYRRAHDLALRAAPGGGVEATTANSLSITTFARGDLAQAEQYAARALAIREKLTPLSDAIAPSLLSYGNVLYARGDLAGAEAPFLRAKKLLEKFQPESAALAKTLHNLGIIAHQRNDQDAAESLFRRELALFEKLDPSGSKVLDSLIGLGEVALQRNQADKAEEAWQHALKISEKTNPEGPKTAWCLRGLAGAAKLRGQHAEAEKLLRRALALWEKINPESVDAGTIHLTLGFLLFEQGDGAAEDHLRTGIRIHEKGSRLLYEGYQALARLQARRGQVEEAATTYMTAVDNLEAQRTRLGGAQESQWLHGSSLGDLYFEAAEHLIMLARPQEAWKLVERGRAQGFQELLAQRDLRFATELPAELYSERRRLAAEYDRAQTALADWIPEQGPEKMETLQGRLRDLRLEQGEVQERIRRSSPRLESLASPIHIDLTAARSALDPGTVLLTYAVGESRSFLFVIQAKDAPGPGLSFYPLPVGKAGLEKEVEDFRGLLGRPHTSLPALKQRGRHLYDLLVRPARPVLAKADRWLISPDGPLHSLPFAALLSGNHYLAESKPIHIVASVAVYKEIKATRSKKSSEGRMELLAVGDPLYPSGLDEQDEPATDPQVRMALRSGLRLKPLPATRNEVKAISGLFSGARILLGSDATEEAIKSLAPQARRLHFACHGLLDERFPLNSALALTLPKEQANGRDNGLLQAWEIFEHVRLDADLVTLSACDTALGREMGGEGLVGLTRAFQYAGARSVLASLWSVADYSTARFMKRFYGYLRSGKTKDEALRAAQIDQIREKSGSSHPFYWAAFQLTGDWR